MNVPSAAGNVVNSTIKVVETDNSVEVVSKSKNIINQTKKKEIEPEYTVINKSSKSYQPLYIKYNENELISNAKCSCGKKSYTKHHITQFKNYCPLCKKSGQISYRAHYEGEWTCKSCGADFCLATGKEKLSSSKKYLKEIK